jgi:hypothetical protein
VRLTSVPYALRSADADTLGGRPASAYLLAPSSSGNGTTTGTHAATRTTTSSTPNDVLPGTANYVAKYVDSANVGPGTLFDTGSFVGIGTTAPLDFFHVRYTNINGAFTGFAVQNLGNTATSYSGMLFYDQNGALAQFQGFNNVTHEYRINNIAQTSGVFNGSINFMTGSISRFLVTNAGSIGIGTTAPGALLDVSNALVPTFAAANVATTSYTGTNPNGSRFVGRHARGTVAAPSAVLNGDNLVGFVGQGYGATGFSSGRAGMFVQSAENWTDTAQGTSLGFTTTPTGTATQIQQMTINPVGNVGIGTLNPGGGLEVSRTGQDAAVVASEFANGTGHNPIFLTQFARGTPAAPTATQSGDVIGAYVTIGYGATQFGNVVGGMGVIAQENWTDTAQGSATGFLATPLGSNAPQLYAAVLPSGNVGLGDWVIPGGTPTAANKLQVFGDIRVGTSGTNGCLLNFTSGTITGTCSSDRRLKKNITPFGPTLDKLTALQPVHYFWRASEFPDRHFGDTQVYGLIAQDVEQVLPELVVTNEDGFKAVDYSKLPLLTIQAVKELKAENDALRAENNDLKARVADIERVIKDLPSITPR